ncbi:MULTISPECIES: helix-turn-helix domain-containing protein [Kitasatospora]|uniref:Putative HxlR family transcriptional regulator n=1 Tax=Kitasatospora setae (strain ATCC 33774 / DSM 43861 / JCM 3304 / KCC A-0304 / NBRC 14216 / KM-6054) TaxID=452652 RepID=E4NDR9_KITSK|nr:MULTISPECIES: helix-turn-helix domain-containing protein [Kitasatospora]BAJ29350.1 putative HxlR family transcriptional regulator [Kitasatospora setae KM-6054]
MATQSAAQRRAAAKTVYNAFVAACPTRQLFATISDKWVGLVLVALADGPRRYGELNALIAGVSSKMLTQTVRTLERDGLVTRSVTAGVPVRVDYALTPMGRSLFPVMLAVKDWAEGHLDEVLAARARYDGAAAAPAGS